MPFFNIVKKLPNNGLDILSLSFTSNFTLSMNTSIKLFLVTIVLMLTQVSTLGADSYFQYSANEDTVILIVPLFIGGIFLFLFSKIWFMTKRKKRHGFLSITTHRPHRFFSLDGDIKNMEPIVTALADEQTNVYSNLSKLTLSVKSTGVFLEDKNYKISILINRRRSRRCFLNDGDIIDMGELTLIYQCPRKKNVKQEQKSSTTSGHLIPRARRAHAKLLKNCPTLVPVDTRKKTFYLTKNVTHIGRSEMNDLIPKSKSVSLMHSKIERVGGRFKLVDLNSSNGTFVNGRRIDSKLLKEKDEISFESIKYVFTTTGRIR